MKLIILTITSLFLLTGCGLQRQINDLKNRSSQSEARAAQLEQDAKNLAERVLTIETQVNELNSQIVLLRSFAFEQNDSILVQLFELRNAVQNQNLEETSEIVTSLRAKISELYDALRVLEITDTTTMARLAVLSQELLSKDLDIEQLMSQYDLLIERITNLQSRIDKLEEEKSNCYKNECNDGDED